ncbi:MAG: hypothetical protein AB7Q69_10255 [Gemmatimonadales bacterium]
MSAPTPRPPRQTPAGVRAVAARPVNRPLLVIITSLVVVNLLGAPYYLLSQGDRVRSPLHPWFRPSGYVGQSAGLLAAAIFFFLWLYPLRKRYRWLAFTGSVGRWLDVHITVALALPLLLAIHASWHFDGLIGLGFASMMVVCVSGIVGKYIYARIPRSKAGIELSREEVGHARQALLQEIADASGLPPEDIETILHAGQAHQERLTALGALRRMVTDDFTRWRMGRELSRRIAERGGDRKIDRRAIQRITRLASREIALTQQTRMLEATQRVFRYWHVAHRPFAITALGAVVVHIAVVVALGVTWLW